MVIVLMGVSGCGKTTVGLRLAERLGCEFHDGDGYHPPENVEKMRRGVPLTEADRVPWLRRLCELIRDRADRGEDAIVACSALSQNARQQLGVDEADVALVHLKGTKDLIASRLTQRKGHYMPADLLDSQFAALEDPGGEAIEVSIEPNPDAIVDRILQRLGRR